MNITPTLKSFFEVSDETILIVQILLMAIMSYYLKLHAPGAKTFFQVIQNSSEHIPHRCLPTNLFQFFFLFQPQSSACAICIWMPMIEAEIKKN